jgi:hypothetical protein
MGDLVEKSDENNEVFTTEEVIIKSESPMPVRDPSRLVQALNNITPVLREFPKRERIGSITNVDETSVKRVLRQSASIDLHNAVQLDIKNESRVLVLYTGGTIGKLIQATGRSEFEDGLGSGQTLERSF